MIAFAYMYLSRTWLLNKVLCLCIYISFRVGHVSEAQELRTIPGHGWPHLQLAFLNSFVSLFKVQTIILYNCDTSSQMKVNSVMCSRPDVGVVWTRFALNKTSAFHKKKLRCCLDLSKCSKWVSWVINELGV